jgi:hypothetical protein
MDREQEAIDRAAILERDYKEHLSRHIRGNKTIALIDVSPRA